MGRASKKGAKACGVYLRVDEDSGRLSAESVCQGRRNTVPL